MTWRPVSSRQCCPIKRFLRNAGNENYLPRGQIFIRLKMPSGMSLITIITMRQIGRT